MNEFSARVFGITNSLFIITLDHVVHIDAPASSFLELFSGRNCAVLKQIYFNTQQHLNKRETSRTFLYSFIKEQKNIEHLGFLLFTSSAF